MDWAYTEYKKNTGNVLRDPDRAIRKLHQEGVLIKVKKGIYRYDPGSVGNINVANFSQSVKDQIFLKDGYKCVICGKGKDDGVDIHADHIKPRDKGGESTLINGQTLCAQHNFQKKNYNSYEFGLKMFKKLKKIATAENDTQMINFCNEVIALYEKYGFR